MEHIYDYMGTNPEFMPGSFSSGPDNNNTDYINAMIGGGIDDFDITIDDSSDGEDELHHVNIIFTGGADDYDDDFYIDDEAGASTVEDGLYDLARDGGEIEMQLEDNVEVMGGHIESNSILDDMIVEGGNDEPVTDSYSIWDDLV
jgi:hypothetical protein